VQNITTNRPQQSLHYQGEGGHTSEPANVEGQIAEFQPVLVDGVHGHG
jgi:hypothetical protein